mgnify:FL=1|tara:strand:- start:376 stop:1023 length:648 start_codon:yes stop_codon:yes gene_type:complete
MGYFRELPELDYQSFLSDSNSSSKYLRVKNLFRRTKIRDDLQNVFTLFNKYEIREGARPDTVAEEFYGSAELDWVVIITAGIINVRNDWPLSSKELYDYSLEVYGDSLNDVHHWETKEIKDLNGKLILPKGKVVDSDFTIPNPDVYNATINPVAYVTNYDYEVINNDKKRSIYILKREYLQQFLNDMRNEMIYSPSSQYVNDDLIRTENTRVTMP